MSKLFSSLYNATNLAIVLLLLQFGNLAADSLYKGEIFSYSMYADKKAHRVGDILTVVVQQNNGATRNNNTTTSKQTSVDASIASFFATPAASGLLTKGGAYPALSYTGKNSFAGGGTINNSETISDQIAVRVIDVLPNGNLVIEGRRQTSFAQEKQDAVLRGSVRPDDVAANNTIFSYNIADATIQFLSKGTITDSQKKGWFTKFWDKFTPF